MTNTPEYNLDALAALGERATKGKLRFGDGSCIEPDGDDTDYHIPSKSSMGVYVFRFPSKEDAELFGQARNALPSLIRDLREAGELLREVEWVHVDGVTFCPSCLNDEYEAHAPDCKLDALLKRIGRSG